MSKLATQDLPLAHCPTPIYLVPKEVDAKEACAALSNESILGFDTETKPAFKAGQKFKPSLVQIAGENATYIFQLPLIKDLSPLKRLLNNKAVKVGVGIGEDLHRLDPVFVVKNRASFVEAGPIAKEKGITQGSLRGLTAILMGKRLSKSVQLSNWARQELTYPQIRYAATDAWVSREVYIRLLDYKAPESNDSNAA